MPVEFIGMVSNRAQSEVTGPVGGPALDMEHLNRFIDVHEAGAFDRILIGYFAGAPDGWAIASHAASRTERLGLLLAHRPGFISPTVAARKAATLDVISGGRFAIHIITGSSEVDQQRDGDYLDKIDRYARTSEFLDIVKQDWASAEPFDYEGRFYRVTQAFSDIKSRQPQIPVYFGGSSSEALDVAAKHADVWATWGESLDDVKSQIADLNARAAAYDRQPRVSVSFRPILGATEEQAWERAHQVLERVKILRGDVPAPAAPSVGSQRLLDNAKRGAVVDERLYTAIAEMTGARGNSTALVGTPDQVAETLLQYNEAGCGTLLIRGYHPVQDAVDYGRDLLPIVREEVRIRDMRAQNETDRAATEAAKRAAQTSDTTAPAVVPAPAPAVTG